MDASFLIKCVNEVHDVIIKNEKEIESLDRAIGDGDHFINLKRGCIAIQSINDELLPQPVSFQYIDKQQIYL